MNRPLAAGHWRFTSRLLKYRYYYLMMIPVLAWYIIFRYGPLYGLVIAFQDYQMAAGIPRSPFVGLKHFKAMMHDTYLWMAFRNTVVIAFYRILAEFPIPIAIAVLLNEFRSQGYRKAIQTALSIPHMISWVVVASMMLVVFSPEKGIVAAVYSSLGRKPPNVLINPGAFRHLLIWSNLWKEAGWSAIVYIAAIAGIDPNLYEAAVVDGCRRWKLIRHVTLPSILPVISIMLILMVGNVINWGFDQVFNLYNPLVYETGDIMDTYIFRTALRDLELSYGAAAGFFMAVLSLALLVVANRGTRAMGQEGIY